MIPLVMSIESDQVNQILLRAYLEDEMFCQHFFGVRSSEDALAHFSKAITNPELELALPDLLFLELDTQESGSRGEYAWEFLKRLEDMSGKLDKVPAIILVAVSVQKADRDRAKQHPLVLELISRPLTSGWLGKLRQDSRFQHLFPSPLRRVI